MRGALTFLTFALVSGLVGFGIGAAVKHSQPDPAVVADIQLTTAEQRYGYSNDLQREELRAAILLIDFPPSISAQVSSFLNELGGGDYDNGTIRRDLTALHRAIERGDITPPR